MSKDTIRETKRIALEVENPKPIEKKQSLWSTLVTGIVRPPRSKVRPSLIDQKRLRIGCMANEKHSVPYIKSQHMVDHEGKTISLTLLVPQMKVQWVILYLHGNSSSKVQAITLGEYLPSNLGLACFDFMGCGSNLEEQTISLGYRESRQVKSVMEFLQDREYRVILWGRSMGAASALLYGKADIIVADSSYYKFKNLCKEVALNNSPCIFNCCIRCLFPCVFWKISEDVKKKAQYDVNDLNVKQAIKEINTETVLIFLSGTEDTLIPATNSEKLYQKFLGKYKYLITFPGNHNSKRPKTVMQEVMGLLQKYVAEKSQKKQDCSGQCVETADILIVVQ